MIDNMLTLNMLELWYKDLWKIILDLHISLNNAKRLAKQEEEYEFENEIKEDGFLIHHWYQLWFIMIVQLTKLFDDNKNQKRNFHKLCNRLVNESYGQDLKNQLEKNKKAHFSNVFTTKKQIIEAVCETRKDLGDNKDLIEKVVSFRDKVFAHSDPNGNAINRNIKLDEIESLINLSEKIFHRLRGQLFNIHMDFKNTSDWHIEPVIRDLSRNRASLYEEHERLIRKRKK